MVGIFLSVPALAAAKIIASEIAAETRRRRKPAAEIDSRPTGPALPATNPDSGAAR